MVTGPAVGIDGELGGVEVTDAGEGLRLVFPAAGTTAGIALLHWVQHLLLQVRHNHNPPGPFKVLVIRQVADGLDTECLLQPLGVCVAHSRQGRDRRLGQFLKQKFLEEKRKKMLLNRWLTKKSLDVTAYT